MFPFVCYKILLSFSITLFCFPIFIVVVVVVVVFFGKGGGGGGGGGRVSETGERIEKYV